MRPPPGSPAAKDTPDLPRERGAEAEGQRSGVAGSVEREEGGPQLLRELALHGKMQRVVSLGRDKSIGLVLISQTCGRPLRIP